MPTPTYDLIASTVLASATNSTTFSSIPSSYRDLVLTVSARGSANNYYYLRYNGDTGSNYNTIFGEFTGTRYGDGQSSVTGIQTSFFYFGLGTTEESFLKVDINDYSVTGKQKVALSRVGRGQAGVTLMSSRWTNTSRINSVTVYSGANFTVGSSFHLYGLV